MTPFRALAVVHLQSTWNRLRKQMGTSGLWALVILLGLVLIMNKAFTAPPPPAAEEDGASA